MKSYVIIGGGIAGVSAVEGIRSVDGEAKITLVSSEKTCAYSRPLISYYLEGKSRLDTMGYRESDFFEKNGVTVLRGVSAERLEPESGSVVLSDGQKLSYDALCVAAGSSPFVPPFSGLDTVEKKFSFMTIDDALSLEKELGADKRVLIIGAGLIGLKCAEGIRDRVKSVTVADLAPHALSSILTPESAEIVERHLQKSGVTLLLGDTADSFGGNSAHMRSGRTVEFDILVLAVGVRANTALVKAVGGEVNRGILINGKMETSIPGVFSAGDCAEFKSGVLAILPAAHIGGFTAGVNMAGGSECYADPVKMNSIGLFGLHIMTAGLYEGEALGDPDRRFFVKDGYLSGFILIGGVEKAGIYTSLMRDKTPLDTIDFDAVMRSPSLLPFGREYRKEKLGGAV